MSQVTRWDPFENLFKDFRGLVLQPVDFAGNPDVPALKVDVKEDKENYTVHADLPGVAKDDIHVSIEGAVVSISAEKKRTVENRDGERVLRSERHFGKVSRSFQLGQDIDESRAEARFADGVLELKLPKKVSAASRKLTIQ
ncbi:Hsp20/alpha crystallin family protein [Methyloversatilis thermotolerans]|jgi:HSP20 family protein|uniref:Hsp20/alpha crystallin family protein n=1 Tax=Methyloversatilis thermotolerans TaxID=1346290 RepID=UPI0003621351|nr:Hsp20/alpha crystallin family protein [Methyloversatilis thermotolerans]